jgi:hypothetical protein
MVEAPEPGIRRCMRCDWLFVSPDPERVRRCQDCKAEPEADYVPRTGRIADGAHLYLQDNPHE